MISKAIIFISFFGFPLFLLGCLREQSNESMSSKFLEHIEHLDTSSVKSQVYFLMPNTGCSGCISAAETFLADNINKNNQSYKNVKFILTNILSIKTLKAKLGGKISLKSPKIIIDKENILSKDETFRSLYPKIYLLSKDKTEIEKIFEMSPNQNGLFLFEEYIKGYE